MFWILSLWIITVLSQDKWCGKHYKQGQPVIHPGGRYPVPKHSDTPRLLFRCYTAISPYIHGEDDVASIVVDLDVTHETKGKTFLLTSDATSFNVKIDDEKHGILVNTTLRLGLQQEVALSLQNFEPSRQPYNLRCSIHDIAVSTQLFYLPPNPYGGSVVKTDYKRSTLLVSSGQNEWKPFIGFGFYTAFDDYLAKNLSILDDFVDRGYSLVHPVPTFGNLTALNLVLDRMEKLGLWLVYDMRWSYKNLTQMAEEVDAIKKRKNLLAWYTADEPDGWTDATSLPPRASEFISQLDGYHPISLVLNCRDYNFSPYTANSPLILHDTYPIGTNTTWSTVYSTECTSTFGDCGCDECASSNPSEVQSVLEEYSKRLEWMGERKVLWSVVQAIGEQSFWSRYPTGREFTLMAILALQSGATGIAPWIAPTTPEIDDAATQLAKLVPRLAEHMLHPDVTINRHSILHTIHGDANDMDICPRDHTMLHERASDDERQFPLIAGPTTGGLSLETNTCANDNRLATITFTVDNSTLVMITNSNNTPRRIRLRLGAPTSESLTTETLLSAGAGVPALISVEEALYLDVELEALSSLVYTMRI